jgi:hypothetical protein
MYELRKPPAIHSESRPTDSVSHIDSDTSLVLGETPTVHVRHSSDEGWPPAYRTAWHLWQPQGWSNSQYEQACRTINLRQDAPRTEYHNTWSKRHRRALPAYYSALNVDTDGYLRSLNSSRCSTHRFRNLLPLFEHTFQVSMPSQSLSAQRAERRSKLTVVSQSRQ